MEFPLLRLPSSAFRPPSRIPDSRLPSFHPCIAFNYSPIRYHQLRAVCHSIARLPQPHPSPLISAIERVTHMMPILSVLLLVAVVLTSDVISHHRLSIGRPSEYLAKFGVVLPTKHIFIMHDAPDTKGFISPALNRIDLFPWNDVFDEGTYPTRFFASFRTTQAQNRRLKTSPGTGSPATDPRRRAESRIARREPGSSIGSSL
jgi:hypothetical protein